MMRVEGYRTANAFPKAAACSTARVSGVAPLH